MALRDPRSFNEPQKRAELWHPLWIETLSMAVFVTRKYVKTIRVTTVAKEVMREMGGVVEATAGAKP